MPHVTIEYSANLADHHDIDALVEAVHEAALDHGLAAVDALRTRAVERRHYRIADGSSDLAFIAIWARIGPGRTPGEKTGFAQHLLDAAQQHVAGECGEPHPDGRAVAIAWSIEVGELDAEFRINRNEVRARLAARSGRPSGAAHQGKEQVG